MPAPTATERGQEQAPTRSLPLARLFCDRTEGWAAPSSPRWRCGMAGAPYGADTWWHAVPYLDDAWNRAQLLGLPPLDRAAAVGGGDARLGVSNVMAPINAVSSSATT
jgi:hypothetical protein